MYRSLRSGLLVECLSCGHCCSHFAPCGVDPCPALEEAQPGIFLCTSYKNRPEECQNHLYPGRFCPIGIDVLGLKTALEVSQRIDLVWKLIKSKTGGLGDLPTGL